MDKTTATQLSRHKIDYRLRFMKIVASRTLAEYSGVVYIVTSGFFFIKKDESLHRVYYHIQ